MLLQRGKPWSDPQPGDVAMNPKALMLGYEGYERKALVTSSPLSAICLRKQRRAKPTRPRSQAGYLTERGPGNLMNPCTLDRLRTRRWCLVS